MNIPLPILFLLGYGLLLGCNLPVQSTILVNLFKQERATAVGIYNFFRFMGAAIGPITGGFIKLMPAWKWSFWPWEPVDRLGLDYRREPL